MKNVQKIEHRCVKCKKLLAVGDLDLPGVEIKCIRCKHINFFLDKESDQVVITDVEGIIVYVNKAMSDLTEYSISEMMGKRPSLWGGHMAKQFYVDLWRRIKEEKQTVVVNITNKKKSGQLYKAILRISPILDEKGDPKFFVGVETQVIEKTSKKSRRNHRVTE